MKTFEYTITDEVGIHARPAGVLAKLAKAFHSTVTLKANGKSAAATKLMAIMAMGITQGTTVQVEVEGEDEEVAAEEMEAFFKENL